MKTKKLLTLFIVLAMLVGVVGCSNTSQDTSETPETSTTTATDQVKGQLFVDADWLKTNLDQVIVLDVRVAKDYQAGHIPGAINAPWQSLANMTGKSGDPGWGTILPAEELAAKLGGMGINGEKDIITYGSPPGWGEDGRVMWVLNMAGISNVKMLDGGWNAWQAVNGEKSKDVPEPAAVAFSIASFNQDLNVTTDYVNNNLNEIKIIDVRSEKEYNGATDFGEARGGHLPGSINLPFGQMYNEDATIKSTDELKKLFADAGLTPEDRIVTYCTKGIRSAHMALVLRNLGFNNVSNWDASFYEWAGNDSLPLEK
ncbi:MAG: sulfurtransferase [Syntrophomonadaceae bacterium]|nr:sulfurtransferase [Syntrophomonadaceae bacterium]